MYVRLCPSPCFLIALCRYLIDHLKRGCGVLKVLGAIVIDDSSSSDADGGQLIVGSPCVSAAAATPPRFGTRPCKPLLAPAVYISTQAAICVAASAQAAAVLNGGRTAHGQLRIPIDCDEASYLDLKVNEKLEVAAAAALLWDEASMVSDVVADCVNRSLQDILQSPVPFGGMPVLFVGDWRQLLPVVPRSVGHHHTLQKCSWWHYVTLLKLHYNWRCQQPEWLQLLDDVGMGKLSSVQPVAASLRTTVEDVIAAVWPDAATSSTAQKAIITLRLEDAAEVNHHIISSLPNATMHAYSYDSFVDCKEPDLYPEEFIRSLRISGTPDGHLELKVGARYIIMRNLDQKMGIVNGAQIICTALTTRHVTGTILYGSFSGRTVVLPRTTAIINSQQSHLPFTVIRRQFPLIPGYSYTVHRSQGSSRTPVPMPSSFKSAMIWARSTVSCSWGNTT